MRLMPELRRLGAALACLVLAACASAPPVAQHGQLDATPRIAIISAFQPELSLLQAQVQQPVTRAINGVDFTTGILQGKPVVLFLSGISMTNAAMNTQLALDRFQVSRIVVSGIAGGVNPQLRIGDVTVPERWGQYLEVLAARETAPGRYKAPGWMNDVQMPNYGMLHPRPVEVRSTGRVGAEKRFWFDADKKMLEVAQSVGATELLRCDRASNCLMNTPKVVVGGNGVSGAAFVDNAAFREYTLKTFEARVLDMETAAIAHVAYSNGVPYVAFRSLSDLAGGGDGENEIGTFFRIAADNSARVLLAFLAAWK